MSARPTEVDVLVVGAGPVGLSASIALSRLGVRSLLVERHPGTSIHPKALHLSTRTMEIMRGWELENAMKELALPLSDHAMFVGSSMTAEEFVRTPIWQPDDSVSPVASTLVSQEVLERPLAERSAQGLGEVKFGTRLTEFEQDDDAVNARVENLGSGAMEHVRAKYMIAADGGASGTREQLGISFDGRDVYHSVNIRFKADLRDALEGRRSMMYYIKNDVVAGLLPAVDNEEDWRLMVAFDPDAGESEADFESEDLRRELVRAVVGIPDLDVELTALFAWTASARLAARFQDGRVFLAGDAAHVNLPSGGLGMNAGIQDAHNLAWKLAAVLRGWGGTKLLETYSDERRPLAGQTIEETIINHAFEESPAETEAERQSKHKRRQSIGLVLGFSYDSDAMIPEDTPAPTLADPYSDYAPTTRPGHRAPHVWLEKDGQRLSSVDLVDERHFVLLVGPDGAGWRQAAESNDSGVPITTVMIGGDDADVQDPGTDWPAVSEVGPRGAVLVRPDGIVAYRSASLPADAGAVLRAVLTRVACESTADLAPRTL